MYTNMDKKRKRAKEYMKTYRETKKYKDWQKNYLIKTRTKRLRKQKEKNQKYRLDALQAYAGKFPKCNCCGESILEFLTIDHISGNGEKHRMKINKRGTAFFIWLRDNNFPEGYQVLCYNCNCAKGFYGVCPHQNK